MKRSTRSKASLPAAEPPAVAASLRAAAALAIVAVFAVALAGCAASQSSGSISDSSGSFSDSSGSSSDSSTSSSGDDTAYRHDVETYTVAHVRAGGSPESLRPGLSEVALARGISDWEAYRATFVAIGVGLAEAGAGDEELAAYRQVLTEPGSENDDAIVEGFAEAKR